MYKSYKKLKFEKIFLILAIDLKQEAQMRWAYSTQYMRWADPLIPWFGHAPTLIT